MSDAEQHDFGVVPENGDCFEFHVQSMAGGMCELVAVVQTERGPRRTEFGGLSSATWRKISARVVRELAQDMNESELVGQKPPSFKLGTNRLSPLVGRELALLFLALQECGASEQIEPILHGWRELAREERWWLFAKAASPGQGTGTGWRRALFHALSEASGSRAAAPVVEKKKREARPTSSRSLSRQSLKESLPKSANLEIANLQPRVRPAVRKRKTAATVTSPN